MVRKKITTINKEIYRKFSTLKLNSCNQIELTHVKPSSVRTIVNDINKNENILNMEIFNNEIIIKKLKTVNFDVYLKRKINRII